MTHVDLQGVEPAAFKRDCGECDALRISFEPGGADELAAGLEAFPTPSRVERLVAKDGARIAKSQGERAFMQLGRDHARDAHGALTDQREQGAVGIHEPEKAGLLRCADAGGNGVERLDEWCHDEAVAPGLECLDEAIGEQAPAACRAPKPVVESVRAPASSRARR